MPEHASEPLPGFFQTVKNVTLHPRRTFKEPREQRTSWRPLLFALVVTVIASVLNAIWDILFAKLTGGSAPSLVVTIAPVAGEVLLLVPRVYVEAGVLHAILWALGARGRRFGDTFDCVCLAMAPWLLSVVPLAGAMAGWFLSLVILVVALSTVHGVGWIKSLVAALTPFVGPVALALGLRAFVIEAFKMPSGSMWPTLELQDHLFVTKGSYRAQRGEAVVFKYPGDPKQDFIKRVIAMSGDEVRMEGGQPIINGWRVPRCSIGNLRFQEEDGGEERSGVAYLEYLGDQRYLVFEEAREMANAFGPYRVADGELFVLGDNRNNSADSRYWNSGKGGGVPLANIKGRAWMIWLSFDRTGIETGRIGHRLTGAPRLPRGAPAEAQRALEHCLAHAPAGTVPPVAQRAP